MSDSTLKLFVIILLAFLNFDRIYSITTLGYLDSVNETVQKEVDDSENTFKGNKVVYLSKNIINNKNILTQNMFSKDNTCYIIQYDYDLDGKEIAIPKGCVLEFQGGSLVNGNIIGNILNEYIKPEWFGAKGDGVADDYAAIAKTIQIATDNKINTIKLSNKYYIGNTVFINRPYNDFEKNERFLNVVGGEFIIGAELAFSSEVLSHLIRFDGVNFTGNGSLSVDSRLFHNKLIRLQFSGCHFCKVNYGVITEEGSYYQSLQFNNCRVSMIPSTFIGVNKPTKGSAMYDISFVQVIGEHSGNGTFFDYNGQYAATNVRFIACCLEGLKSAIKANAVNQFLVLGCYFEGNSEYDILFYEGHIGGSNNTSDGVTILSNCFYPFSDRENQNAVCWKAYCMKGYAANNISPGYKTHSDFSERNNNLDLSGDYFVLGTESDTRSPYYRAIAKTGKIEFGNPKSANTASQYRYYNKGEVCINPSPTDISGIGWICTEQGLWETSEWRRFGQLLPENEVIPKDGDFNNYQERGVYRTSGQQPGYEGYAMVNAPIQESGMLIVNKIYDDVVQTFYSIAYNPSKQGYFTSVWQRQRSAFENVWFNWKLIESSLSATQSSLLNSYLEAYPNIHNGFMTYCTDLNKIVVKSNNGWLDHNGNPALSKKGGKFADRPVAINGVNIQIGTQYFCTDRKTVEGNSNGIMIFYKGEDVWVDALGRIVK